MIELARNFGHHAAILVGLAHAGGERIFLIDSDLEENPELLIQFSQVMKAEDADVVFGVHERKVGSISRRLTSGVFWKLFNLLSETKTETDIANVRLMSRDYVDALLSLPERNVFLGGLFKWPGFHQHPVLIERRIMRPQSTYSVGKRLALAVRSIVAFSTRPLHVIFWLGLGIAMVSALVAIGFLLRKLLDPQAILSGFTTLVVSIWFLSGLVMASLGVIGIYVAYVYAEVKARPRTIVRRFHGRFQDTRRPSQ